MNEAEYAVLTAPVDMTKEDVQNRAKNVDVNVVATKTLTTVRSRLKRPSRLLQPAPAKTN